MDSHKISLVLGLTLQYFAKGSKNRGVYFSMMLLNCFHSTGSKYEYNQVIFITLKSKHGVRVSLKETLQANCLSMQVSASQQ